MPQVERNDWMMDLIFWRIVGCPTEIDRAGASAEHCPFGFPRDERRVMLEALQVLAELLQQWLPPRAAGITLILQV